MWKMTFEVIEIPCNGSHIKDRYKFVNLWGRIDLWCIFNGLFFFSRLQHQTKQQFSLSLRSHRRVTTFSVTSHPENNASLLSDFWSQNFIKRLIYGLIQNIVRSVEVQTSRTLSFWKLARLRDSEHFNLFFFSPRAQKIYVDGSSMVSSWSHHFYIMHAVRNGWAPELPWALLFHWQDHYHAASWAAVDPLTTQFIFI